MHYALLALAAQAADHVTTTAELSSDAKWILGGVAGVCMLFFSFVGRVVWALMPAIKDALHGIGKLPAAIDGVKQEVAALRGEVHELREEVLDHRTSKIGEATAVALAVATGTVPDFTDPAEMNGVPRRSPTGRFRALSGSSPELGAPASSHGRSR